MKNILIPKKIKFNKKRFGSEYDGGYIFAETPISNQKIYGFGVNNDISCEVDLNSYFGGDVNLYDGTCDFYGGLPKKFTYNKINVTSENINSIIDLSSNCIVKMDIEYSEYECIAALNSEILNNIEQFIIEFHMHNEFYLKLFYESIIKLQQTHKIFHLHGNNDGWYINEIPSVFEISFLNKKLCDIEEIDYGPYPNSILDRVNNKNWPDMNFKWW